MQENCTSGTVRGVPGNRHSYRRGGVLYMVARHWASPRESAEFPTDVKGVVAMFGPHYPEGTQQAARPHNSRPDAGARRHAP